MFEAARWAMSGYNDQPAFLLLPNKVMITMIKLFMRWCLESTMGSIRLYSVLLLPMKPHLSLESIMAATFEAGIAGFSSPSGNTLASMPSFGGIHRDEIREAFNVPEKHNIICGFVCGHHGALQQIPESFHEEEGAPRTRKALSEIVFGALGKRPISKKLSMKIYHVLAASTLFFLLGCQSGGIFLFSVQDDINLGQQVDAEI